MGSERGCPGLPSAGAALELVSREHRAGRGRAGIPILGMGQEPKGRRLGVLGTEQSRSCEKHACLTRLPWEAPF